MKFPLSFDPKALLARVDRIAYRPIRLRPWTWFRLRPTVRGWMAIIAALALAMGGYLGWQRAEERRLYHYFDDRARWLTRQAERAERDGQVIEAEKARAFAGDAARQKRSYRP